MHRDDRLLVEAVGEPDRRLHRAHVRHDELRVRRVGSIEFGERDLLRARGEVLDLGARRALGAQEDRRERRRERPRLGVEPGEFLARVVGHRKRLGSQLHVALGDHRNECGTILADRSAQLSARRDLGLGAVPRPRLTADGGPRVIRDRHTPILT